MDLKSHKKVVCFLSLVTFIMLACNGLIPLPSEQTPTPLPADDSGWKVTTPLPPDAAGIDGVKTYGDRPEYHDHVDVVQAPADNIPPPYGAHYSAWQNCGIYDQPIELGNGLHSLEHGAVWLTYSPDLSESQIADLQGLVRGHDYVLMSPYPDQPAPVVLTAWGVQLMIDSLPDDRIERFIAYYENGPQNPEPGAPCSGAIGEPLP
jgi:hypothetical protein